MKKKRTTLSSVLILLIQFTLTSCTEKSDEVNSKTSANANYGIHHWNAQQILTLKQLSISSLNLPEDKSNHAILKQESASLGHDIFFDQRFSSNNKVSCASCHQPDKYFTDGLKTAQGINNTLRNTPTIVGASHNNWFFHDGRSDSLWSQALGPLENAAEHGGNRSLYAHLVFNDPRLRQQYDKVFGTMPDISDLSRFPENAGPVKNTHANNNWQLMTPADQQTITQIFVNIGKSLASYEIRLQPDKSRFDEYVDALIANDSEKIKNTLNKNEVTGLRLFMTKAKCILCHNGPLFTDKVFHNIGSVQTTEKPYDLGRYEGAKKVMKSEFNCRSQFNDNKNDNCDELKYIHRYDL